MADLEAVLKDFEQRLSSVEAELQKLQKVSPVTTIQAQKTLPIETEEADPSGMSIPVLTHDSPASVPASSVDSSSVLAIIGIAFVILAGAFFIKMSIDSGFLTPMRQVILAAAFGMGFFLAPQFLPQHVKAYGAFLAGAGTTILHLTWVGAYTVHSLLPATVALICASFVGVGSVVANFAGGNRIYLLVAMAGTYLALPIVGYSTADWLVICAFLLIWNVSFSLTALAQRRRDILFVACYFAMFSLMLMTNLAQTHDQRLTLLIVQLLQLVIFAAAMLTYSVKFKDPLSSGESIAILVVLLLFYWSTYYLLSLITPNLAPWFGISIGAFVLAMYLMARRYLGRELKSDQALLSFSTITWVHCIYFELLSESLQPATALMIAIASMLVWYRSPPAAQRLIRWPLLIVSSTIIYGTMLTLFAVDTLAYPHLYNLAYGSIAVIAFLAVSKKHESDSTLARYIDFVLGIGHLEVLLGLYRFSIDLSWSGALFVSLTWGCYAVLILATANWRRDRILGHSALIILLAVGLKAIFYDLVNTTNLVRVGCLLGGGLLLYGCGWFLKKMRAWD